MIEELLDCGSMEFCSAGSTWELLS
jgi:hypothetical protein